MSGVESVEFSTFMEESQESHLRIQVVNKSNIVNFLSRNNLTDISNFNEICDKQYVSPSLESLAYSNVSEDNCVMVCIQTEHKNLSIPVTIMSMVVTDYVEVNRKYESYINTGDVIEISLLCSNRANHVIGAVTYVIEKLKKYCASKRIRLLLSVARPNGVNNPAAKYYERRGFVFAKHTTTGAISNQIMVWTPPESSMVGGSRAYLVDVQRDGDCFFRALYRASRTSPVPGMLNSVSAALGTTYETENVFVKGARRTLAERVQVRRLARELSAMDAPSRDMMFRTSFPKWVETAWRDASLDGFVAAFRRGVAMRGNWVDETTVRTAVMVLKRAHVGLRILNAPLPKKIRNQRRGITLVNVNETHYQFLKAS